MLQTVRFLFLPIRLHSANSLSSVRSRRYGWRLSGMSATAEPHVPCLTISLPQATMTMTVGPAATSMCVTPSGTTALINPYIFSFSNTPSSGSDLSGGIIAGIVFAVIAFLTVIGASVWLYRRKAASRPQPVLPYLHREGKSGDRSSIISGKSAATMKSTRSIRSALSLWSTFGSRQDLSNERSHSVEDGVRVEVDTVQVVEEPKTPITMPASGAALFTPRRTTREWTGYNGSGNRKSDEMTRPSTILSNSSITDESTQIEFPNRQMPKPDYAPFNNNYIVYGLGDAKIHPIATSGSSHTDPSEQDASQLSQRDLEALADIVAARINQRNDYSSSSSENHRATPNTTDLPPRYY